jgi:NAD(P)-dependent dehydrogenase (short-subunit alcohol dehydrogenase family)
MGQRPGMTNVNSGQVRPPGLTRPNTCERCTDVRTRTSRRSDIAVGRISENGGSTPCTMEVSAIGTAHGAHAESGMHVLVLDAASASSREGEQAEPQMELTAGKVAVVTGAASGIGLALARRFASSGLDVVLADVEESALGAAAESVERLGVKSLAVRTDVSDEASVRALAAAAVERFGSVHVVCNNAGVESVADPWLGPVTSWQWVLGVNLWGVIHGIRAFLPILAKQGEGHIVNTASMAGLVPGASPPYDAAKHAVVAISEDLYKALRTIRIDVGVSVLCPGIVRTRLLDADRNWPASLGQAPPPAAAYEAVESRVRRAVEDGMSPVAVAGLVAEAVATGRFWILTHPDFTEMAVRRWQSIAVGENPRRTWTVPSSGRADERAEP